MNTFTRLAVIPLLVLFGICVYLLATIEYNATRPAPATAPEPVAQFQYTTGEPVPYLYIVMDTVSGCYYIYDRADGAITPRNWSNGTQMCADNPDPSIPYPDEYPDDE